MAYRTLVPVSALPTPPARARSPWLGWSQLTLAEQVVAGLVVGSPVIWAVLGFEYLAIPLVVLIVAVDWFRHGRVRLQRPRLEVSLLLAFGLYATLNANLQTSAVTARTLFAPAALWMGGGLLLWYIQSNRVRVRAAVLLGAFFVSTVQMLAFWLVIYFGFGEPFYTAPPSLFAALAVKLQPFVPGTANPNYLQPYIPDDPVLPGLARYSFFFGYPEVCALVVGFVTLLAFDVPERRWTLPLVTASALLLVLSGTRSVWLALPVVLALRYVLVVGKVGGRAALCALVAVAGFVVFSLPPATGLILDTYSGTVQATGTFRRDSTDVRNRIYLRTWERLGEKPLLGHGVPGRTVLPGYAYAGVGTHSFWLGGLFYQMGLVGTGLFVGFWAALAGWLYKTRKDRPVASLMTLLLLSAVLTVMEFEMVKMLLVLLCVLLVVPEPSRAR